MKKESLGLKHCEGFFDIQLWSEMSLLFCFCFCFSFGWCSWHMPQLHSHWKCEPGIADGGIRSEKKQHVSCCLEILLLARLGQRTQKWLEQEVAFFNPGLWMCWTSTFLTSQPTWLFRNRQQALTDTLRPGACLVGAHKTQNGPWNIAIAMAKSSRIS